MMQRVLVAMSGGVDSSVAATLLLEQGFAVEGVTMKLTAGLCCDIASAQAVCSHLGIPHRTVDLQREFEKDVIRDFIDEYRAGRTPNPCILCNSVLKFEKLLDYARAQGFPLLATGHYARVEPGIGLRGFHLLKGADAGKDQSYFLYRLSQDQLRSVLFPLGGLSKSDVRLFAAEHGLPAADRPESQEICFVPNNDYRAYLRVHAADVLREGEIVLTDGTAVGRHEGIAFYTIGQRRRVGVASGSRLYVIRIEPDRNRVVLGQKSELDVRTLRLSQLHLVSGEDASWPLLVNVKVRYRSPLHRAILHPEGGGRAVLVFEVPVSSVSPGQAAVFYEDQRVIGGGVIDRSSGG